jgi:hypothetical protein
MEHSTILTEYNNRQYFLKLAKTHNRKEDVIRLSKEINQLEFQATQFLAQ